VQLSDVLQYVFGKLFGRHRIAPRVSPKKTWEGLARKAASGGLAGAAVDGALADVGGGDVIAGGGEAQGLGTDTTSSVQHPPDLTLMPGQQASITSACRAMAVSQSAKIRW
jgi:hypothetical protein